MQTTVTEIGDRIYRLSTYFEAMAPGGFSFNQFLIDADQPLLFHCGMRSLFSGVSSAVATIMPLKKLRWISFGHVEADECGAMNQWLAQAPHAQVLHGQLGIDVSIRDLADREPVVADPDQPMDIGGRRIRLLQTPHLPHAWESIMLFEESTHTLFCGDLGTHLGKVAMQSESIVAQAIEAEHMFRSSALTPHTETAIRGLAALRPRMLAIMHGASYQGDGEAELGRLADGYAQLLQDAHLDVKARSVA